MGRNSWITLFLVVVVIGGVFLLLQRGMPKETQTALQEIPVKNTPTTSQAMEPPKMAIDINKAYVATLHTSQGNIIIKLTTKQTPKTVNNFVYLARKGFYDGTIFHRVIKGFMIQGGDPKGDGTGGPGYRFADEPFDGDYIQGTVAMANAGSNTNGSQFFIMHEDYQLPKNYVIFGNVIKGIDVVDKIANSSVEKSSSGENSKPVTPTIVSSVEILEE